MTTRLPLGQSSTVRHPFKGWELLYSPDAILSAFEAWYPEVYDFAWERDIVFQVESHGFQKHAGFSCTIYGEGNEEGLRELVDAFPLQTLIRPLTWRSLSNAYLFASSDLGPVESKVICPHSVFLRTSAAEFLKHQDLITGPFYLKAQNGFATIHVHCRQETDAVALKLLFG